MRMERIGRIDQVKYWRFQQHKQITRFFVQKKVWEVNCHCLYRHLFYPLGELHFRLLCTFYLKTFWAQHEISIEGYVGADGTNFPSLKTIPLNLSRERWELLLDHIFDKSSDLKTALIYCPKLTIFNMTELAKPPEAKVALKPKPPEAKIALK